MKLDVNSGDELSKKIMDYADRGSTDFKERI